MEGYSPESAPPSVDLPSTPTLSFELPSISTLDHLFISKPPGGLGPDSTSLAHSSHPGYNVQPNYKPQLPALSVDHTRRAVPPGRPGSPFSFGNPPPYPRVSPGKLPIFLPFNLPTWAAPYRIMSPCIPIADTFCRRPRNLFWEEQQTLGHLRSISGERARCRHHGRRAA
jgi:hypothetical protein